MAKLKHTPGSRGFSSQNIRRGIQALCWHIARSLQGQESFYELPCTGTDVWSIGEFKWLAYYVKQGGFVSSSLERSRTVQQFIQKDAESPPVYGASMSFSTDNLWCQAGFVGKTTKLAACSLE